MTIGKNIRDWIQNNIDSIVEVKNNKSFANMQNSEIALHLHRNGRCAIAHASGKAIIDPDSSENIIRISNETDLLETLASYSIKERFEI